MITLSAAALAYASHGYYVFPLAQRSKEPFPASRGFKDATTDPEVIARWWNEHPDANIGLHPAPSGLVVIDVDGPEGRAAAVPLGLFSEPTLAVMTGRADGGSHLYYTHPGFHVSNRQLAPHLHVRGDDGYVVLPPSIHPSGAQYRWDRAPVLALPPDVLAALKNGSAPRPGPPLASGILIPDGMRNTVLASLAGTMRRRGMEAGEIAAALLAVNAARCAPPLDDDKVEAIAQSVSRYAPADAGRVPLRMETRDDVPPPEPDAEQGSQSRDFRLLDDVEVESVPDAEWEIEGLFETDALVVLYGASETAKTFLALDWALHIATGRPWRGRPVKQGPVAFIASEGWSGIRRRVVAWKTAHEFTGRAGVYFFAGTVNAMNAAEVEQLLAAIRAKIGAEPMVITLDTLNQAMGGGSENDAKDMGLVVGNLQLLRRATKATVLVAHHTPWEKDRERGHGSLRNAADTMLALTIGDDGEVRIITCTKQRNGPHFEPIQFGLRPEGDSLVLADPPISSPGPGAPLTRSEAKALAALQAIDTGDGVSFSEWRDATSDLKARMFAVAVKRLVQSGHCTKGKGRYGRYQCTTEAERVPF